MSKDQAIALSRHPRYFTAVAHKHTFFEITMVCNGSCRLWIEEQVIIMQPGANSGCTYLSQVGMVNGRHTAAQRINGYKNRQRETSSALVDLWMRLPVSGMFTHR